MSLNADIDPLIVTVRRTLERHTVAPQDIDRPINVIRSQCDVLNALAMILAQVFLYLALVVLRFVDRNTNLAARARHRTRQQARLPALDVEVADLPKVE